MKWLLMSAMLCGILSAETSNLIDDAIKLCGNNQYVEAKDIFDKIEVQDILKTNKGAFYYSISIVAALSDKQIEKKVTLNTVELYQLGWAVGHLRIMKRYVKFEQDSMETVDTYILAGDATLAIYYKAIGNESLSVLIYSGNVNE